MSPVESPTVATYPSVGGRRETHRCVLQERNARGVPTNVYSRKTSKKLEKDMVYELYVKGSGVVFTHGEGISTPRVRHKRRQPLIKCANMTSILGSVATYTSAGGRRVTRGMRVPRKEYARSRHQRLFEENVGKTGKGAIYELLSERFGSCIYARGRY